MLGPFRGLQIAPLNIATGRVEGVQLGVVNVAGEVRGLQVGLLNISQDAAAPIGLVSIVRRGRTSLDAWGSESGLLMVNVTHGGRVLHNIYGVGARVGPRGPRFVLAAGLGARLLASPRVNLDFDALVLWMLRGSQNRQSTILELRLPIEARVSARLGVFVAPSFQFLFTADTDEHAQAPAALVTTMRDGASLRTLAWPGLNLGLRVHLGTLERAPR